MADITIIGAGHNSLVASIYLARAGHDVHVFEKNHKAGGLCINEEIFPGEVFSKFASWYGMLHPQIIEDLDLYSRGLKIIKNDRTEIVLLPDGRYFSNDLSDLFNFPVSDQIRQKATDFWDDLGKASEVLKAFQLIEYPKKADYFQALGNAGLKILTPDFVKKSLVDLAADTFGEDSPLAAFFNSGTFHHPCRPGSTYGLIHAMTGNWGHVEGCIGRVSEILYDLAIESGVRFSFNWKFDSVLEDKITVFGTDGYAAAELCPELFNHYHEEKPSGMGMFHAILDKDIHISALQEVTPPWPYIICLARPVEKLRSTYQDYIAGNMFYDSLLSFLHTGNTEDGSQKFIVSIHFTPDHIDNRKKYTDSILDLISVYIPDFRSKIKKIEFILPQDVAGFFQQEKLNCFHGDITWDNAMDDRSPVFGAGPRTPRKNLYICSGIAHPAGTVSGMPGYRCAQAIINDLKEG